MDSLDRLEPESRIAPLSTLPPAVATIRASASDSRISDGQVLDALDAIHSAAVVANKGLRPFPHPFPARMPLDVAKAAIRGLSGEGGIVCDPMLGSGTTAAAAIALNRRGVGFDTDPLAVLLATARCRPASPALLACAVARVAEEAKRRALNAHLDDLRARLSGPEELAFLDRWFSREAQLQLFALIDCILAEPDVNTRTSLTALFSSMIITKQGGVTFGLDISRSRAHYHAGKNPACPFDEWERRAPEFIRHAEASLSSSLGEGCMIGRGDARALPLADTTVDLVLTSPPYLDAIDYMRASRFGLVWLGYTLATLRKIRGEAIGSERALGASGLAKRIEKMLIDSPAPARRKPMLRRFLVDMLATLRESRRYTKPGGIAVYVVGPSLLTHGRYDGGDVLGELAQCVGWSVVGQARRDFASDRRSLPPPRRALRSEAINKRMSCEFYVALRNAE